MQPTDVVYLLVAAQKEIGKALFKIDAPEHFLAALRTFLNGFNLDQASSVLSTGYLRAGEVAKRLGVSRAALDYLEFKGKLRPMRDASGDRYYKEEDVMQLAEARKLTPPKKKTAKTASKTETKPTKPKTDSLAELDATLDELFGGE